MTRILTRIGGEAGEEYNAAMEWTRSMTSSNYSANHQTDNNKEDNNTRRKTRVVHVLGRVSHKRMAVVGTGLNADPLFNCND